MEKTLNQVYDTDYSDSVVQGWYPVIDRSSVSIPDKRWRIDRFVDFFVKVKTTDWVSNQESIWQYAIHHRQIHKSRNQQRATDS